MSCEQHLADTSEFNRLLIEENRRLRAELDDRTRERDTNIQLRKENVAALRELQATVGDLQAAEAELVSGPLRVRISTLQRQLDESENSRKRFFNQRNEAQQNLANHKAALMSAEKCLAESNSERDKWRQVARDHKYSVDALKEQLNEARDALLEQRRAAEKQGVRYFRSPNGGSWRQRPGEELEYHVSYGQWVRSTCTTVAALYDREADLEEVQSLQLPKVWAKDGPEPTSGKVFEDKTCPGPMRFLHRVESTWIWSVSKDTFDTGWRWNNWADAAAEASGDLTEVVS